MIERFEPQQIMRLSRDAAGTLTGTPVMLPDVMKPKSYRQYFRRALGEAMLGQGVIVVEGLTERDALIASADKMEEADASLFPLDVSGVSVIDAEGQGNLQRLGQFFKTIGIPAFAFFDRRRRTQAEIDVLADIYEICHENPYPGAEALLVAEVPVDRQWQFLQALRAADPDGHYGIPAARSNDDHIREHTRRLLEGLKGAGGAARLLELCLVQELPGPIRALLSAVYKRFPKPQRRQVQADNQQGEAT